MLSFRVDDDEAGEAQRWAKRLGLDRSELLRQALHAHLVRLAAEAEVGRWIEVPLSGFERSLGEVASFGPAEDWSDWADWPDHTDEAR